MSVIVAIIISVGVIYLCVRVISLEFRNSYLRQKLMNRTNPEEKAQIDKTDCDFWSFLK